MSRWRCARGCCEPFEQATDHQPSHLCDRTGAVDDYVADIPAYAVVRTLRPVGVAA
jgi:hypothetical protein